MIILYWIKRNEVKNTLPADESVPKYMLSIQNFFLFDHKIFIYIRADI